MDNAFQEKWTLGHKCEVPGCTTVLVIDGGLKPHRSVCAAKISGIKVFEEAGVSSLVGCPNMPMKDNKFCKDHENCESPVMAAADLTKESKSSLAAFKKSSSAKETRDDDFFVLETILRKEKDMYLVKWVGVPESEATYEKAATIHEFIRDYYEQKDRMGKKLPAPKIKHTKTIGGGKLHQLQ